MKNLLRKTIFYKFYKKIKATIANIINGNPSKNLFIIGITGTDGKTTTSNLIYKIINENLGKSLLISTSSIRINDEEIKDKGKMTSLDPMKLQKLLYFGKTQGCKYAVLEVSSHGIDQYRFEGIDFDIGILTNITKEHLDYHGNFESYINTKKHFFKSIIYNTKPIKKAVFPKDDLYGRKRIEEFAFDQIIDYGISTNSSLKGENIQTYKDKTEFQTKYLGKTYNFSINLLGEYNVYNTLAAVGTGILLGIKIQDIQETLKNISGLSGRMEKIEKNGIIYYVDFAHTPNGLKSILTFINSIKEKGKVITVFGAPGNRDKYKRPQMGEIVDKNSDIIILTDDDPDTENRYQIINQISQGIQRKEGQDYLIIPQREFAVKMATEIAKEGDIVILAGKGHENIQLTNFGKRKYSDIKTLKKILKI